MEIERLKIKLKGIIKEDNFLKQPYTSKQELIKLEEFYGISTNQMLEGVKKEVIPEEVINTWINTYQTYLDFGGE